MPLASHVVLASKLKIRKQALNKGDLDLAAEKYRKQLQELNQKVLNAVRSSPTKGRMKFDHGTGVKHLEIIMAIKVTYKYRGVSYTKMVVR